MNLLFITKHKITYDEAPPSRILNIKKVLENYHSVILLGQRAKEQKKDSDIYTVPNVGNNFIANQLFKLMTYILSIYIMFKRNIDFIIVREYYYVVSLYPFAKLFRKKILYDMHCFRYKEQRVEGRFFKSFFTYFFETLAHRLADHLMVVSQGLYDDLPQEQKRKSFLLPNGVNVEEFQKGPDKAVLNKYNVPKSGKLIGFIGNWMEWVDVDTLLKSSKYLDKNVRLIVIGECYKEGILDKIREKYPLAIFTGRIPHSDAISLLKAIDVCVLPYKKASSVVKHLSIRKTFEYLSAGKPIIMSNSDIGEKKFLKPGKNILLYNPEDPKDLANCINKLSKNNALIQKMGIANRVLASSFTWEKIIDDSELLDMINTYKPSDKLLKDKKISIIIKALNEEAHIAGCIESALSAVDGLRGEVILVDSKSTDKTVEIAKKYPIKIIQLLNEKDRCCGIGPQIGYLYSKGDYIYILDGDMTLDKDFVKKAFSYMHYEKIAGVGGNITEKSEENLAFQVRKKQHYVENTKEVGRLGMGGLYKRDALQKVGHFSNPYLYAYEEYELGAKLDKMGYKLLRIPQKMVEHYGDETTSIQTLVNRWKSKYLFGSGQYLRKSASGNHFFRTLFELKIYVFSLLWFFLGIASLFSLIWTTLLFIIYFYISAFFIVFLIIIRRNLRRTVFSIISWNFQALGMLIGFFIGAKNPLKYKPNIKILKNG